MIRNLADLVTLLLLLLVCLAAKAQDTLVTIHGNQLAVKLIQVSPQVLFFHQPPNDTGTSQMPFREVFMIKYGNGAREVFQENITPAQAKHTAAQLRALARKDVARYQNYTVTGIGTGVVSALYLPVGLVMALATGKPATIYAHEVSDYDLLKEHIYVQEYKAEAQRRKRSARFLGFGIGAGTILTLIMLANTGGH